MARNVVKNTIEPAINNILTYKREHPGNWVSFAIDGVPGRAVFDKRMFANGVPKTITVDCALALPVPKAPKATPTTP